MPKDKNIDKQKCLESVVYNIANLLTNNCEDFRNSESFEDWCEERRYIL